MGTVIEELVAVLGYKVEGKKELAEFKSGIDGAAGSAAALGAGAGRAALAAGALAGGIVAVGTAAVAAAKKWSVMEERVTSWANTSGISVPKATATYMALAHSAFDVGLTLNQAADAFEVLLAAGMKTDEALSFFPQMGKYIKASGAEAKDAALLYDNLAKKYGLSGEKAKDFFDIVNATANAGKFENKDFASQAPKMFALSEDFFPKTPEGFSRQAAIASALGQFSSSGQMTATAYRQLFSALSSSTTWEGSKKKEGLTSILGPEYTKENLQSGKISWDQFAQAFAKTPKAIDVFNGQWGPIAARWLAGTQAGGEVKTIAQFENAAKEGKGSVEEGWRNKMDSVAQSFTQFQTALDHLGNVLGMISSGPVREGLNGLADAAMKVAGALEAMYGYLPNIKNIPTPDQFGRQLGEATRGWVLRQLGLGPEEQGPPAPANTGASDTGFLNKLAPGQGPFNAVIDVTPPPQYNVTVGSVQVQVQQGAEAAAKTGAAVQSAVQGAVNGTATGAAPGRMQPGPSQP